MPPRCTAWIRLLSSRIDMFSSGEPSSAMKSAQRPGSSLPTSLAIGEKARVGPGRSAERLGRREAKIVHEDLELARMPFAVGRDRKARIAAGHHRHAGLVGLGEVAAGALVLALRMADAAVARCRLVRLGELDDVALEGESGRDRGAALEHRVDAFIVEVEGMEDQIDAGTRGVKHGLAADRVDHRLAAEPLDLAHHGAGLFLGERGNQGSVGTALDAVERDFHAVDAVLGLDADLLDRFVPTGDQPADRRGRRADPARIPIGQALACRDVGPGGADARPVEQTGADRVANRQADLAGVARRAERGVAGR